MVRCPKCEVSAMCIFMAIRSPAGHCPVVFSLSSVHGLPSGLVSSRQSMSWGRHHLCYHLLHCMSMPGLNNRRFNLLLDDPAGEWGQRSPHDQRPHGPAAAATAAAAQGPACAAAQRSYGGLLRRFRQCAPHQPPAAHRRVNSLPFC